MQRALLAVLAGLFVTLVVTGIVLTFHYEPTIHDLTGKVVNPSTARTTHRFCARALFVVLVAYAGVALARVLTQRRAVLVVVPAAAIGIALFASLTGYLLPWDQLSLYSITVGTNTEGYRLILHGHHVKYVLVGNQEITQSTFSRWYWIHSVLVPVMLVAVVLTGVWLIRRPAPTPEAL